jgi:hypothetical protein
MIKWAGFNVSISGEFNTVTELEDLRTKIENILVEILPELNIEYNSIDVKLDEYAGKEE